MDDRHRARRAIELERDLSSRILAADDDDPLAVVAVRLVVVVRDVREILAGHIQSIRVIVVADGERRAPAPAAFGARRPTSVVQ